MTYPRRLAFSFEVAGRSSVGHSDVVGVILKDVGDTLAPTIDMASLSLVDTWS